MIDLLQIVASIGGVGAVFGIVVFLLYRIDRKNSEARHLEAWRASEERLKTIIEQDQESRRENTKALTELTTLLIRINGKSK